jgi:hypothetical protein
MDISKFNQALSKLVSRAKRYESLGDLEEAIEAWVKVTEFTLKISKIKDLDSTYRNMLITKTDGIIKHIKTLKGKLKKPKVAQSPPIKSTVADIPSQKNSVEHVSEKGQLSEVENRKEKPPQKQKITTHGDAKTSRNDKPQKDVSTMDASIEPQELKPSGVQEKEKEIEKKVEKEVKEEDNKGKKKELGTVEENSPENVDILEDSEFKNLPEGVKELKVSKEFETIIPFDSDEVNRRLGRENDVNRGDNREKETLDKKSKRPTKIICSVCGEVNSRDLKICKNCGTPLEK